MFGKYEPVRNWLYGVLTPGVALLVGYGVLNDEQAPLWIAAATAALGFPAAEIARTRVHSREWLAEQSAVQPDDLT